MSEARYNRESATFNLLAGGAVTAYEVWQLPTGEAAFLDAGAAVSGGQYTDKFRTDGKADVAKATGVVLLAGQDVWWDHSANQATYAPANDRDFRLGTCVADAASAAPTVTVDLNKRTNYKIDLARTWFDTVLVGTQAAGGFGEPRVRGGGRKLVLSATNEAQKVDLFSLDRFDKGAAWIAEAVFCLADNGSGSAPDFSVGVANATHATDASSIAERLFVHLDGNSLDLYAESADGTTTVTLTDTTVNVVEAAAVANRVHVLFDGRDPADVQVYVNGALVLGATTFSLAAATGPLGLLAHLEKTAAADVFEVNVETLRAWTSQQ